MEEEISSAISNGETNVNSDISDSSSNTHPFPASKGARYGTNFSSEFKGVVAQQSGHWGAQIYTNHQRIWLGTFNSEKEAAIAYDSALIKLRSGDLHRNFPWTNITVKEPNFQSIYSTEAILNMIRDGTYQSRFADFIRTCSGSVETEVALELVNPNSNGGQITCKQMFQKELTPSDVGKLNRLVIPKRYAMKYFPPIYDSGEENVHSSKANDIKLEFFDRSMRLWKFRYCYWSSSQTFVFTRGWNRFVKDKQLKANDVIVFYSCENKEMVKEGQTFCMIDVNKGESSGGEVVVANECVCVQVDLQLQLGQDIVYTGDEKNAEEKGLMEVKPTHDTETKGFKLFGVQII